ncbi:MAG TPA: hypothetical protein GX747_01695 [Tenericutes bacterium]|nr:hypothetical protein [Mycoplasmatota bacterium]
MKIIRINAMWCSGCIVMKSRWRKIEKMYDGITYIDYDLDMDEHEVTKYNVKDVVPVYIFLDNDDNILKRIDGEVSKTEIINSIEEFNDEV